MRSKFRLIPLIAVSLLLIPFIGMQFSDEVNWSVFDFLIMGAMLLVAGIGIDRILQKQNKTAKRIIYIGCILFVFILLWAEMAVGLFGTCIAGN
jgi:uncharacterized membrane protein